MAAATTPLLTHEGFAALHSTLAYMYKAMGHSWQRDQERERMQALYALLESVNLERLTLDDLQALQQFARAQAVSNSLEGHAYALATQAFTDCIEWMEG